MKTLIKRRQYDKQRFQRKYPLQKKRGEALNFIASTLESPQDALKKEINLINYIQVELPYSSFLSKNKMGFARRGNMIAHYKLKETCELQDQIVLLIQSQKPKFVQGKVWVEILVQKPQLRGDAANYVDRICDAIQTAIGINDSWFSLKMVDWQIVRKDPKIVIGIGQEMTEEMKGCTMCGRVLPINPYFIKPTKPNSKPHLTCKSCRSKDVESLSL